MLFTLPFPLSNFLPLHTIICQQFLCVLEFSFFKHYCLHILAFCIPILPFSCAPSPHSASTCIWSLWCTKIIHCPMLNFFCHSSTQQSRWLTVGWNSQLLFHIEMKSMFLSWNKECLQTIANWWYQCWCNLHTASHNPWVRGQYCNNKVSLVVAQEVQSDQLFFSSAGVLTSKMLFSVHFLSVTDGRLLFNRTTVLYYYSPGVLLVTIFNSDSI